MDVFEDVKQNFDEIYGSLQMPVFLFGESGKLLEGNQAFADLVKINLDEILLVVVYAA